MPVNYVRGEWYVRGERERARQKRGKHKVKIINQRVIQVLKLTNLRSRINLSPKPKTLYIIKNILKKSKKIISEWDGRMYFVYLTEYSWSSTGTEQINHEFLLHTATELGIPIIDINREVFASHPDPLSLFPFNRSGHYNAEGYRLIAKAIRKRLMADGIIPSISND